MKGNYLIVQSGGPTSVINSTLCGIIEEIRAMNSSGKLYGAKQGLYGLLHGDYVDLSDLSPQEAGRLKKTPGAALGTWRHKLTEEHFQTIINHMRAYDIRFLFYIGGNGSMYVADQLNRTAGMAGYPLSVVGIPKTIDNDIMHTHHTPGYGSAAKFIATCTLECGLDIQSLWGNNKITILETMGRNTGWLAAASILARGEEDSVPHRVYIPESPFSLERFLLDVQTSYETYGYALAVVSEGIRDDEGNIVGYSGEIDRVGRPGVGGVGSYLAAMIEQETPFASRSVVPAIWQRTGMHVASGIDVKEAFQVGKAAVRSLKKGSSGSMISLNAPVEGSFTFGEVPLANVASHERPFPLEWYDAERSLIKAEFREYALPLIQGEVELEMKNGLPRYQSIM
ncbi:diphosphate--fructose-6-phosphate 1-phosphotransferase [Paenibacillus senegalensis]|uniref:diphosphate--fructose-6-phosphate 1-phosphotransferase n=1 Tax=Paenibacillus senegalensis TaxID=1465766 RepID=UPI0002888A93|nr:diphosphate--fructose-6-phosphate 1-phosphotransferase [Paenibacillus senegalensis]